MQQHCVVPMWESLVDLLPCYTPRLLYLYQQRLLAVLGNVYCAHIQYHCYHDIDLVE